MFGEEMLSLSDFAPIELTKQELAQFNKVHGEYRRRSESASKPTACLLCGKPCTSFCNSHSIPQFCLREIAVDGQVLTFAESIGTNLAHASMGIAKAGAFRAICSECDNAFFKRYENEQILLQPLSQRTLGRIAVKTLLARKTEALRQTYLFSSLGEDYDSPVQNARAAVRQIDYDEDEMFFKLARAAAEGGNRAYKTLYYAVLDHVAPIAYQTTISPIVDLDGGLVNNLLSRETSYLIEPLYVCCFPLHEQTVLLVFRHRRTDRYRDFDLQFRSLSEEEKQQAILKLVFAYSDQLFFSPLVATVIGGDEIRQIASLNIDSLLLKTICSEGEMSPDGYIRTASKTYSLNGLPEIPNLFGYDYRITHD